MGGLTWQEALAETNRLQRELDITNADHIALWIEANTIPDEPMNQCASWLACRIVEAHEAVAASAIDELTNALKWYADPEIYKPSPHGLAFDDRDLSYRAISVLKAVKP